MKFKNMKIAITDEVHLKAVCDVLGSMGYSKGLSVKFSDSHKSRFVGSNSHGIYAYYCHNPVELHYQELPLTDLLAMRDQLFMESIR